MQLSFRRTPAAGAVYELPVQIWFASDEESDAAGIALVAEILPLPGPHHAAERLALAAELQEQEPIMLLFPTAQLVQSDERAPARMWLGETERGLKVAAFICAIQPVNDAMDRMLARELMVLPAVTGPTIPNMALAINPDQALR
jgi:hypothetical protein